MKCAKCKDEIRPEGRVKLGYRTCLDCGDGEARRVVRTIVPGHKSAYMLVTDLSLLKHLNKP